MANEYTTNVQRVLFGPYDAENAVHTILHPRTDSMMVQIDGNSEFNQASASYLTDNNITLPGNLEDLVGILSPAAFGGVSPALQAAIDTAAEAKAEEKIQAWIVENHATTGMSVVAEFMNASGNVLNSSASSSVNIEVGNNVDYIRNVRLTSSTSTGIKEAYLSKTNSISVSLDDRGDTGTGWCRIFASQTGSNDISSSGKTIAGPFYLDSINLSRPVVATSSVKSVTFYAIGVDRVNSKDTAAASLSVSFRKPAYFWTSSNKDAVEEAEAGTSDTSLSPTVASRATKKLITDITTLSFSYSIAAGDSVFLYLALPYSPCLDGGSYSSSLPKFFGPSTIAAGYNPSRRIVDADNGLSGGWRIVNDNFIIPSAVDPNLAERYVVYRSDNAVSNVNGSSAKTKKFSINGVD